MECNKEEAVRAKEIAESKMVSKDFQGARKIALKAQRLYNELENISQMLSVCDVHCAAEQRLFGNEMDWYGILQVEITADEATIRKQYRKFALQLHPDKNKFPGAEAAFKLIGEAQRVLLDRGKRSLHDIKRKAQVNKPAPPYRSHPMQRTNNPSFGPQNNYNSNFRSFNLPHQQPQRPEAQQGFSNGRPTFWTACPFCNVKYQHYIEVINKPLICQNCSKPFVAYERSMEGAPSFNNFTQPVFPKKDVPNQGAVKVELRQQGNAGVGHCKTEFTQKKGSNSERRPAKADHKKRRMQDSESSESCNTETSTDSEEEMELDKADHKKRRMQDSESSESCNTETSTDSEEEMELDKDGDFKAADNFGSFTERPRRSVRRRQEVSYKENLSDDEDYASPSKKDKGSTSSRADRANEDESGKGLKEETPKMNQYSGLAADVKYQKEVKQKEKFENLPNDIKETLPNVKGKERVDENGSKKSSDDCVDSPSDSSFESLSDPDLYVYPDPEFKDFDKDRNEESFSAGQVWAVYDTLDAMPRFYARVRKVFSPGFRVRITWLEPFPDDQDKIEWVNEGLPASCGKFKNGNSENTEDRLMFSHLVFWETGSQRDSYKIVPRKGESWALFKNWDIRWKSNPSSKRKYEYEFVEILSEYTEEAGALVTYLGKVKGFVSLFCRISKEGRDTFQIPPDELFRFSHMVPSFKLTGDERNCVPKGSFELDPASLPKNIEEVVFPKDSEVLARNTLPNSGHRTPDKVKLEETASEATPAHKSDLKGSHVEPDNGNANVAEPALFEYPDPEFFDFESKRSNDQFQVGQIWALYGDEDGLPKYYSQITKVNCENGLNLHLKWLAPCALPKAVIQWHDENMPICCGRFKISKKQPQSYTSTISFSHQLYAESTAKKNEYTIWPRNGEVWALYRNWSSKMKCSDLENCEYDIVEVLEQNDLRIKVLLLERVAGFNSVFKVHKKEGSIVTVEVIRAELLRFSHQIPAFRLTDERSGSLRGFWELDPASLPVHFFSMKR